MSVKLSCCVEALSHIHSLAHSTSLLTNSLFADRHSLILESRPSRLTQTWLGLKLQQSKLNTHNFPLTKHLLNKRNSHLSWLKHYSFASVLRIRFIFTHLEDTFIQCDLHRNQGTQCLIISCIPWESNPLLCYCWRHSLINADLSKKLFMIFPKKLTI